MSISIFIDMWCSEYCGLILFSLFRLVFLFQPNEYCDIDSDNTICARAAVYCRPCLKHCSKHVEEHSMTITDRKNILTLHNKYRNDVASGKISIFDKTSANTNILGYSLELEDIAQCHANACSYTTDVNRNTPNFNSVGQNTLEIRTLWPDSNEPEIIMRVWMHERYSIEENLSNDSSFSGRERFLQIIWAQTELVGCGKLKQRKSNLTFVYYVCNYYPRGNVAGEIIFKPGDPCKQCSHAKQCNNLYPALCGKTPTFPVDPLFVSAFNSAQQQQQQQLFQFSICNIYFNVAFILFTLNKIYMNKIIC